MPQISPYPLRRLCLHRLRPEVVYGDPERNALTLHFISNGGVRIFGSPAFIYFPTAAWHDYYWSKARSWGPCLCGTLLWPTLLRPMSSNLACYLAHVAIMICKVLCMA